MDADDLAAVAGLEESLWRPETRFDAAHLGRVLHEDFAEIGASGRRWSRDETVAMPAEAFDTRLPLPGFSAAAMGPDAVLTTYRSETRFDAGAPRVALRSSVWLRVDGAWRLRFHQGTPAG